MRAILALAEKRYRYRRSVAVLQHKLKVRDKYGVFTKRVRKVKMASIGRMFWVFMNRNKQKKERSQYSAILTEQAWMIKDLSHSYQKHFSYEIERVVAFSPADNPACKIALSFSLE